MSKLFAYAALDLAGAKPAAKAGAAVRCNQGTGAAIPSGASSYAAARVARIVLRREPVADEVLAWTSLIVMQASAARGRAELALVLLALPELAGLDAEERTARAYDAVMGRYGAEAPKEMPMWRRRQAEAGLTMAQLVRGYFVRLAEAGEGGDPCAAPVDARRPFFVVRDGAGSPLVFAVGGNLHLYMFRRTAFGNWSQTDLSAALPHPMRHRVQCVDVRQAGDGTVAVALAVGAREGAEASTLYVASGLSGSMDEAGWIKAFRTMQMRRRGFPEGAVATRVAFGPLLAGAAPLVLVTARAQDEENTWYFNAAAPSTPMSPLRLQGGLARVLGYAVGSYRLPGAWTLVREGGAAALTFASFPDQFGWAVNVEYRALPYLASSFHLAQGTVPNVPDVFVAGEGIVVYRGGHDVPQPVARVNGAELVWSDRDGTGEHLAYTDGAGGLWLVSRELGSAWGQPRAIADTMVATALCGDPAQSGVHAVGVTPGGALMWMKLDVQGNVTSCEEITQAAVWEEAPLEAAELNTAA
ncbi:hypothetical protein [Pseudoduganella namucuonensis]|uniref:Uncharacterized protein n=1 Tax=Pseudoduganella namucuonensis TaxID=1035707 RepID=A0A1I7HR45_9BURK|nr:hypothetical protein [Pseudoduganella namucuonensis]SFU63140.1 hypothetical protein SAMN05216552_1006123 [Pseudoduganella namucuonensis]